MASIQRGYQYPSVPKSSQSPLRPRLSINTRQTHHLSYIQTPVNESARNVSQYGSAGQSMAPASKIPAVPSIPTELKYTDQALAQFHDRNQHELDKPRTPSSMKTPVTHANSAVSEHKFDLNIPQGFSELSSDHEHSLPPTALPDRIYLGRPPFSAIQPDENPLSPTVAFRHPPHDQFLSRSNTTNMKIIPPPSHQPIQTSSYTPSAPGPPPKTVGGTWTHSLFSLTAPALTLSTCICPGITYSKTNHRLKTKSDKKDPTNMLGFHTINSTCIAWTLLCPTGLGGVLSALQKRRVRKVYEMDGDQSSHGTCGDCLEGCCCCCCLLVRNEREVRGREEMAREGEYVGGNGLKRAYKSPSTMTYSSFSTRSTFESPEITKS